MFRTFFPYFIVKVNIHLLKIVKLCRLMYALFFLVSNIDLQIRDKEPGPDM